MSEQVGVSGQDERKWSRSVQIIGIRQQEIVDLGRWAKIRNERVEWTVRQMVEWVADDTVGV